MNILVSACLIGLHTRYAGDGNSIDWITQLAKNHALIPVCPEQLGGLPTPRVPYERVGALVVDKNGEDRTHAFVSGAEMALHAAQLNGCQVAILFDQYMAGDRTFGTGFIQKPDAVADAEPVSCKDRALIAEPGDGNGS